MERFTANKKELKLKTIRFGYPVKFEESLTLI